jgi:hypothetical protein
MNAKPLCGLPAAQPIHHHRTSYPGIEFHCASSPPCHSKASRRPNRTGTLLRRHLKAIKAGSVVHFASAVYTIRQVYRNVKRWRDTRMPLRWTGAAMQGAAKAFCRLKRTSNCRRYERPCLPIRSSIPSTQILNSKPRPRSLFKQRRLPSEFQHGSGHCQTGTDVLTGNRLDQCLYQEVIALSRF